MVSPWDPSPLGPVLAESCMVHLERTLMVTLKKYLKLWKRYVCDTNFYIKPQFITDIINVLNGFHENIKFTYEVEHNGKISFLEVVLVRSNGKFVKS